MLDSCSRVSVYIISFSVLSLFSPALQDKRAVERLSLEKAFHPFIAGAHNRLVQELSQETGARISIPPPSLPKDEIVITGEKEAVALAVNRIRAIYEDKVMEKLQAVCFTALRSPVINMLLIFYAGFATPGRVCTCAVDESF